MTPPDIFNHVCTICGQLRRTLHKQGWVWRVCTQCDQPVPVKVNKNDEAGAG